MGCFDNIGKIAIIHTCPLKIQRQDYSIQTSTCVCLK